MTTANDILKQIKDNDIKFVDLRFTDPKGKLQHVTMDVVCVDEDMFADGVMFDGSSIAGWKAINESDMVLMPDPATVHMDPFFAQSTMVILCDILDPVSGEAYNRDPRGTAKKAEAYLKASGIGDTIFVGPEPEFFVFDDVKYKADPYNTGFKLDSSELPSNDDSEYETGNLGHRPRVKGGYFPVPPIDSCQDMRSEMLTVLGEMGVVVEKHHHEVAAAQHELGIKFDALTRTGEPGDDEPMEDFDIEFTPVRTGPTDLHGYVQVLDGLQVGDVVVLYSETTLTTRTRIREVEALPGAAS